MLLLEECVTRAYKEQGKVPYLGKMDRGFTTKGKLCILHRSEYEGKQLSGTESHLIFIVMRISMVKTVSLSIYVVKIIFMIGTISYSMMDI